MKTQDIVSFARFVWGYSVSEAQLALLKVLYGLPLSTAERGLWRKYAEKGTFSRYNPREFFEALAILGRQSGKSRGIGDHRGQFGNRTELLRYLVVERFSFQSYA